MNNKFFKLCMLAAVAMGANACDTGEYNDLNCDSTYVSECLSSTAYMVCKDSKLEVGKCSDKTICIQTETGHQCVSAIEGGAAPECTASSCNGNILNKCDNGKKSVTDCSQSNQVCDPNTLACVTPTEKCTESTCTDDTTLSRCDTDTGTATPVDCSATNQICGDKDGVKECIDKPAETCTATACDADGVTLKVCEVEDGEDTGIVKETKNCSKDENGEDTGLVCGAKDDSFDCVEAPEPETCTATACDADGVTLKVCEIEDGEDTGIVKETKNCSKDENDEDTGLVCGAKDDSFDCVEKCDADDTLCDAETNILYVCDTTTGILSVTKCVDDNDKVCGTVDDAPACVERVDNSCSVNTCDDDGKLVVCNEGVKADPKDCAADGNKVCGDKDVDGTMVKDCIDRCTSADNACIAESETLKQCDQTSGLLVDVDCAKDNSGMVCETVDGAAQCIDACVASDPACSDDNKTIVSCGTNGHKVVVDCDAEGKVCGKNASDQVACIDKCTADDDKCSDDGLVLTKCDTTTGLKADTDLEDKNYCGYVDGKPASVEAPTPTGMPCTCDGDDCDVKIKLSDFKAMFAANDKLTGILNNTLSTYSEINDDSIVITGPNPKAISIKGCEALTAPTGMTVSCYRGGNVTVHEALTKFLREDIPAYLLEGKDSGFCDTDEGKKNADCKSAGAFESDAVASLLSFIFKYPTTSADQSTAYEGYCMPLYLRAEMIPQGIGLSLVSSDSLTAGAAIPGSFNTDTGANPSLSLDELKNVTCPDGTSLYVYDFSKNITYLANTTVRFAFCLQNCTGEDDTTTCRTGFKCMRPVETEKYHVVNYTANWADRPYVCFSDEAETYFNQVKSELAQIPLK